MRAKPMPPLSVLEEWFYVNDQGTVCWRKSPANRVKAGDSFGTLEHFGASRLCYRKGAFKEYGGVYSHRVAYTLHHPEEPPLTQEDEIDHINGNGLDNSKVNLRRVSRKENMSNKSMCANNNSGCMGVYWDKASQKWRATIGGSRKVKRKHLGYFCDFEQAVVARKKAESELDYHPNHGRYQQLNLPLGEKLCLG